MKKLLLAVLAVAAVAVVAILVVVVNTRERRMDRKLDKLLRSYEDDPKQLRERLVDDRDLLGFVLVDSLAKYNGPGRCVCYARTSTGLVYKDDCPSTPYRKQHQQLFHDYWAQIGAELCDCETAPAPLLRYPIIEEGAGAYRVFSDHPEDCSWERASRDIEKKWAPYILRKTKEFREARRNR